MTQVPSCPFCAVYGPEGTNFTRRCSSTTSPVLVNVIASPSALQLALYVLDAFASEVAKNISDPVAIKLVMIIFIVRESFAN